MEKQPAILSLNSQTNISTQSNQNQRLTINYNNNQNQNEVSFDQLLPAQKSQLSQNSQDTKLLGFDSVFHCIEINVEPVKKGQIVRNRHGDAKYRSSNILNSKELSQKENIRVVPHQSSQGASAAQQITQMLQCNQYKVQIKKLQKQLSDYKKSTVEYQKEIQQYKKQLLRCKKQLQNNKNTTQIQKQSYQSEKIRTKKSLMQFKSKLQSLQQQLKRQKAYRQEKQQQLQKSQKKLSKIQKKLAGIQQQNQEILHKLKVKEKQLQKQEEIIRENCQKYQELFAKKQQEIHRLRGQISNKDKGVYQQIDKIQIMYCEKISVMTSRNKILQKQSQILQQQMNTLNTIHQKSQKQILLKFQELQKQKNELIVTKKQLENQLQLKNNQIAKLLQNMQQNMKIKQSYLEVMQEVQSKEVNMDKFKEKAQLQKEKLSKDNKQLTKEIQAKNQSILKIMGIVGQGITLLQQHLIRIQQTNVTANSQVNPNGPYVASFKRFTGQIANGTKNIVDENALKFLINIIVQVTQNSKCIIKKKTIQMEDFKIKYQKQILDLQKKSHNIIEQNRYLKSLLEAKKIQFQKSISNVKGQQVSNQLANTQVTKTHKNSQSQDMRYRCVPIQFLNHHKVTNQELESLEKQQQILKKNMKFVQNQRNANLYDPRNYHTISQTSIADANAKMFLHKHKLNHQGPLIHSNIEKRPERASKYVDSKKAQINEKSYNMQIPQKIEKSYKQKTIKEQIIFNENLNIRKEVEKARKLYKETTLKFNYDTDNVYRERSRHKSLTNLNRQLKFPLEKKIYI